MKVTIHTIAKRSGYGVGTVSRALSAKQCSVKASTRAKILKVAEACNYVKDASASVLVTGRSADIGLVMPFRLGEVFYDDFFLKLIGSVTDGAYNNSRNVRLIFQKPGDVLGNIARDVRSLKLSGLIFSAYNEEGYADNKSIDGFFVPTVFLNEYAKLPGAWSVILDDFRGGYEGMDYLLRLGHRKIAILTSRLTQRGPKQDFVERLKGCRKALAVHGMSSHKGLVMQGIGNIEYGYEAALAAIRKDRPTAIFALNDEMALGAIRAIKAAGLKCPSDISVLGFDGIEIGRFVDPQLTTMSRPVGEMAQAAVAILTGSRVTDPGTARVVMVKASILERGSCAAVK